MVKPPRHSKPKTDPVTIDLDEKDVKQVKPEASKADNEAGKATTQTSAQKTANTGDATKPARKSHAEKSMADKSNTDKSKANEKPASDGNKAENSDDKKPSQPSVLTMVASGFLGALIALGGAYGVQQFGVLGGQDSADANTGTILQQISVLEATIADVTTQLDANSNAATDEQVELLSGLAPLATRMDDLETLLQNDNESTLTALNNMTIQIDDLSNRLSALEAAPTMGDGANGEASAELVALQTQMDELLPVLAALQATNNNITALQGKLAALEESQANLSQERSNGEMLIARNLAANSIASAINRGDPFQAELNAYRQIDQDHEALGELTGLAAKGVSTKAELVATFDAIANDMIASDEPLSDDDSILSRLVDSASSMIKVRQVGDIAGTSTEAIVARIEARLIEADWAAAGTEWQNLTDSAKEISSAFKTQLDQRMLAEELAQKLMVAN